MPLSNHFMKVIVIISAIQNTQTVQFVSGSIPISFIPTFNFLKMSIKANCNRYKICVYKSIHSYDITFHDCRNFAYKYGCTYICLTTSTSSWNLLLFSKRKVSNCPVWKYADILWNDFLYWLAKRRSKKVLFCKSQRVFVACLPLPIGFLCVLNNFAI